ncbi:MAG TPA: hypothetical protein PKH02_11020 [Bacteroidales bacterium]|nr:hypothetical protein [Bacteroidales bacterium]
MTHLGVSVNRIVNLVTMQLKNDNRPQVFCFDRNENAPFVIPEGYSFVVTDIIVNPEVTTFSANQFFLVVITIDGGRSFTIRCDGHTAHYSLTAGLVIPEKCTSGAPRLLARNTTFSTGPVEAQILGYFVEVASGLPVGRPFTH